MTKQKILYLITHAPNYRDKFFQELGKYVDLTVAAYPGAGSNLQDPSERVGYKYISLRPMKFMGFHFNPKEYFLANGDYDIIIIGFVIRHPFRIMNIFRRNKRTIPAGLIYGKSESKFLASIRKFLLNRSEGVLVYSNMVRNKLKKEIKSPVRVFNNTSFYENEITPLHGSPVKNNLNIIWVGRYQERKKIKRLYELAKIEKRVDIRLIGPGIKDAFKSYSIPSNFKIFDATYNDGLIDHFRWSHAVMNPGHAGLLVMSAGKFGRPIIVDCNSAHAPEIQMAKDANQDFIDFSCLNKVTQYIDYIFDHPGYLEMKGIELAEVMKKKYTIENMVSQYLKAINGDWKSDL